MSAAQSIGSAVSSHAGRVDLRALTVEVGPPDARVTAFDGIDLDIEAGQFVCVLGPSGCGKSTLLAAIAGHLAASQGRIEVDGVRVDRPHPDRGLVFQQHTLFPWKRVVDNVAFGLKVRGVGAAARRREARELLELVGLDGYESHYPAQLSGGMQQRVEIARVLINRPRVLLMDEPFAALDAQTRKKMQRLLLDVWSRVRTTVIFVTHDIDEALFLGERVVMLSRQPARIIADIDIPFARPRTDESTLDAAFVELKRRCLALLREPA
ncbi:MAG: ABC transporter ATP-binding protein [Trinickia sp.]|uniref:ABC transporter ATP-binding protein n=1 Tax=Trinickia sp. TaxID=2571163 RepID=UPI003F7FE499